MPSLYKAGNLASSDKRSVPIAAIAIVSDASSSDDVTALEDSAAQEIVEERVKELWVKAQSQLAAERDQMLAEVEEIRVKTRGSAYQEGLLAGQATAKQDAEHVMQAIRLSEVQQLQEREKFIASCQTEITELIITVTESILKSELQNPERVIELVSRAISELVSRKKVIVFIHPDRVNDVSAYSYLLPPAQDGQEIIFRADPTLSLSVFRVEDDSGSLVVDLPKELLSLRRELGDD